MAMDEEQGICYTFALTDLLIQVSSQLDYAT